jgi:hypothetical protein
MNQELDDGSGNRERPDVHGDPPMTIPHHFGFRLGVALDKLNDLADDIESEAFVARYRLPVGCLASCSRTERSVSAT